MSRRKRRSTEGRIEMGERVIPHSLDPWVKRKLQTGVHDVDKISAYLQSMLTRTRKFDHISSIILIKLHWLPIRHRINFKLIMLTWKALHDMAPNYLCELLLPYTPKRTLRSTDKLLLTTPRTLSSYGDRAFYAAAPKLWNTLPLELRSCTSIDTFKKSLKTYLFEIVHDITTD